MKRKILSLEETWHEQAEASRRKAEQLPHGKEREGLLRKAHQFESASHVNDWLSSQV